MNSLSRLAICSLLFLLFSLPSCGRKTPAIPPEAVIPATINDIQASLDSNGVTLRWAYPKSSIDGIPIKNIRSFLVDKAISAIADYCPGCPTHFSQTFKVSAQGKKPGDLIIFHDSEVSAGHYYTYTVRSYSGWQITSAPAPAITLRRDSLLSAPAQLSTQAADQVINLSWQPVTTYQDGSPLRHPPAYQLQRGSDGKNFAPLGQPITELNYRDAGLLNGQNYYYRVYAVIGKAGEIHGLPSVTVKAIPQDMVAPLPPRNISVIRLAAATKIFWQPVPDSDLGGYYIYRRRQDEEPLKIGMSPPGAISFLDPTNLAPGIYFYSVAAFDQSPRHNESAHPIEVRLTIP